MSSNTESDLSACVHPECRRIKLNSRENFIVEFTLINAVQSFVTDLKETGPDHPQTVNETGADSKLRTLIC